MLTINSYSLLFKSEEDAVFGYRINIFLTLMLHFTLFAPVLLQNMHLYYLAFYLAQMAYLFLFPIVFRAVHRRSNRLLINLMMIMLSIGLPILTRLGRQKAVKQFVFLLIASAVVLFIPMLLKRFETTRKLAAVFGILGLMMLTLVLLVSRTTYGANLSLNIGPISLQPSEFVKLTYVLLLAVLFRKRTDIKRIGFVTAIALMHTGVLVLSKDLGGALIYFGIFIAVLYVASEKPVYPALAGCVLGAGGVVAYYLFSHVRVRITAWLDPWSVINNQGYQVAQSLFSLADGGLFGSGVYLGSPKSIPVVEKDFVFSAICEELGAIFGICLILLCLCLLLVMVKMTMKNSVALYKLIGVGFETAYGIQTLLTIGGAIKLIPSTGVTLPFVSYGGSSLIASIMMFGILQGLFIKGNRVEDAKRLKKELEEATSEEVEEGEDGKKIVRKRVKVPNKKQKALLRQDDTMRGLTITSVKPSKRIGIGFSGLFFICIVYLLYFVLIGCNDEKIVANTYHTSRVGGASEKVIRGDILGSDMNALASTTVSGGKEQRTYPYGNLFAHVVGYTSGGMTGLESIANKYLLTATRNVQESLKEDLSGSKKKGDSIVTTINPALQYTAYTAMGDTTGAVVVMEADTGDILCMLSKPDYDPNNMDEIWENISQLSNGESFLVNRAAGGMYPPGSTFKLLTMLAYLRSDPKGYLGFEYDCTGSFTYDGIEMKCAQGHVHGHLNLFGALAQSCNGAFAKIGTGLPDDTLIRIADDFLFNKEFTFYPMRQSSLPVKAGMTAGEKMQICIGQGAVTESPLHNCMITAAIANGGVMMQPKIIKKIVSSTGKVVKSFADTVLARPLTKDEASIIEEAMLTVTKEGTGYLVYSDEYYSAGKTGSAQYGKDPDALHAWYTGYAWKENGKKIVVSVILEGGGSGGVNAAPIAKAIFDQYMSMTD